MNAADSFFAVELIVVVAALVVVIAVEVITAMRRPDCGRLDCTQRRNRWHRHAGPDGR